MTRLPTRTLDLLFPISTPNGVIRRATVRPMTESEHEALSGGLDDMCWAIASVAGIPAHYAKNIANSDMLRIAEAVDDVRMQHMARVGAGEASLTVECGSSVELAVPVEVDGVLVYELAVGPVNSCGETALLRRDEEAIEVLAQAARVSAEVILDLDESDFERLCTAVEEATNKAIRAGARPPALRLIEA